MSPKDRITQAFAAARAEQRAAIMPYMVSAHPSPEEFVDVAKAAADAGADMFELGIPFSDPIMDGPVIAAASNEVLSRGLRVADALKLIGEVSSATGRPLCAMTYYNLLYHHGLEDFARALADAGVCGAIVPDLSVEDSGPWREACAKAGIAPIFIAAQTSPQERLRALASVSEGFVYAASLLGVTGVRDTLNDTARGLVERIKKETELPVAVGIGVSTPEHAREVASFADGVIVGSAIVQRMAGEDPAEAVASFIRELRAAATR